MAYNEDYEEDEEDGYATATLEAIKELADKCNTIEEVRDSVAEILKGMDKIEDRADNDGMTDEQYDAMLEMMAKLIEKAHSVKEAADIVRDSKINK